MHTVGFFAQQIALMEVNYFEGIEAHCWSISTVHIEMVIHLKETCNRTKQAVIGFNRNGQDQLDFNFCNC